MTEHTDGFWTAEKVAEMQMLWTQGHSASAVGRAIGASRSAVLGKLHRMRNPPPKRVRKPRIARFTAKTMVGFDQRTADRIATMARERRVSRGAIVRDLVEMGLCVTESLP